MSLEWLMELLWNRRCKESRQSCSSWSDFDTKSFPSNDLVRGSTSAEAGSAAEAEAKARLALNRGDRVEAAEHLRRALS